MVSGGLHGGRRHEMSKKRVSGGLHGGCSVIRAVAVASIDRREGFWETRGVWSKWTRGHKLEFECSPPPCMWWGRGYTDALEVAACGCHLMGEAVSVGSLAGYQAVETQMKKETTRAHSSQLAVCDAGSEGMKCLLLYAGWVPLSVFSISSLLLSPQGFSRVYVPLPPPSA